LTEIRSKKLYFYDNFMTKNRCHGKIEKTEYSKIAIKIIIIIKKRKNLAELITNYN